MQNAPVFLTVLLQQKTNGIYGINRTAAGNETTLIIGKLDDIPVTSIDNSLNDFHESRRVGR